MSRVEAARAKLGVTALAFVARATIDALREHPALNAWLNGEDYTRPDDVNLGIAVSLGEDGLIVPVIHKAQELSVEGLAARIKDIARRARARRADRRRRAGRDVHDHQPGPVRLDHGHADHQPAAGGHPRPRGGGQARGRGHRSGRQRLDRHPADDDPGAELGPPCAGRRAVGPVPGHGQAPAGEPLRRSAMDELWVCHLGTVDYREAPGPAGARAHRAPGRRGARRDADARALARVHARPALGAGRAADGRGLVPGPGDRRRRRRPRRQDHLPRPRPAGRLPDRPRRRRDGVPAHARGRPGGRAAPGGDRRRARPAGGRPRLHRRLGRGPQDRLDRRPPGARRDHPRVGRQRGERPAAVLVGRGLRPARGPDDLADQGDRPPGRPDALLPQAGRLSRWPGRWGGGSG